MKGLDLHTGFCVIWPPGTARRNRQAIYEDLRKHGIDPTNDREEPPSMPTNTIEIPAPGWRHPSLISVTQEKTRWGAGNFAYVIAPFTGDEDEPQMPSEWHYGHRPDEPDLTSHDARRREFGWVRKAWADARFLRLFKALYHRNSPAKDEALLKDVLAPSEEDRRYYRHPLGYDHETAGEVWDAFTAARNELVAAYEAMKSQPDNLWRAGLGRVIDATEPAEKTARKWDGLAQDFWKIAAWYDGTFDSHNRPGEDRALRDVAKKAGVDADDWLISYPDDYRRSSYSSFISDAIAEGQIANIIEKGQGWLENVRRLAGDR